MNSERWRQIEEIFQTVVERDAAERDACLTQLCCDDAELRGEVESLLAYELAETLKHQPFERAIKGAARSLSTQTDGTGDADDELIGRRIGAYRVTHLIGQGGMGAVYAAVRADEQFEQQVAIKIIRRGMETDFVRGRFLRERQILASLEHPYIARLLDGGATEDGRPYFVMEFVAGEPVTGYCQRHNLSLNDKLKLFRQVCAAVQHAHQKLIVHRDIKPSNILVTEDGVPKLLDFGIAKLLARDSSLGAVTETALRMLTPDYASPEQARGQTITTAADVYSLGVVLYELLTEQRPHQFKTLSPAEIERAICETAPLKPSDAVSRETAAAGKLQKQLAGDLDNIILMALRKEPERRYQSVEQFSEDLRRHLEGLPVSARADTFTYRASKFVRRHKLAAAAAAFVVLSLLGGIVATMREARIARAERARAERRFQQVRKLSNTFLFDFHDEIQHLSGSTKAREMVVRTALEYLDSLARESAEDPALERELAEAYRKVGDVQGEPFMFNLGHTDAAMRSYQKSVSLAQKLAAQKGADAAIRRTLAEGYFKLGVLQSESGDKATGLTTMQQALSVAEPLLAETDDPKDSATVENCHDRIGDVLLDGGDPKSALASYRRSQQVTERRATAHPSDNAQYAVAACHSHIGETLAAMGDLSGAMENFRQYQSIQESLVQKNPTSAFHRRQLHVVYQWLGNISGHPLSINLGDSAAAMQYFRQSLAITEELVAADPKNASAKLDLASSYFRIGGIVAETDPARGAGLYRQALAITRALLDNSPNDFRFQRRHANYLRSLAAPLLRLKDRSGALQTARQSLAIVEPMATQNPANLDLQNDLRATCTALAAILLADGEHAGALEHYRRALVIAESAAAAHPADLYVRWHLAEAYADLSRYHATLAAQRSATLPQRLANWRTARDWAQKSLAVWDDWETHGGVSSVFNATRRERAARALAQCEAAISRLTAAPAR